MGFGGGQSQNSTTKTEPWSAQQPYLKKGFEEAENIYEKGPSPYYPGQTYADMSDPTKAGLEAQTGIATSGNPLVNNASSYASSTLGGGGDNPWERILNPGVSGMEKTANGDFLTNNPYLDQVYGSAAGRVKQDFNEEILPGLNASLGSSGNAGSTTHELMLGKASGELTDSLADLSANIYGGDYAKERDRMTNAQSGLTSTGANLYGQNVNEKLGLAGMAPGLREAQYGDAGKLQEAGKAYEANATKGIEDDINRFNYNQNADLASLQDYLSMISGNFGSTSTSRTSQGGNGAASALGGLTTLLSLFG